MMQRSDVPALQEAEAAPRRSFANLQGKLGTQGGLQESPEEQIAAGMCTAGVLLTPERLDMDSPLSYSSHPAGHSHKMTAWFAAGHPQQAQQDSKKSRFSLNFLRASLLSPKGSSASKGGSIFGTAAERNVSAQPAPANKTTPPSTSSSPSRQDSVDTSAASAQHWSPLGHGASALSVSQTLPDEQADAVSSWQSQDTFDGLQDQHASAEPRSPLRALSSNSPTRQRHHSKQTADDAVGNRSQHVLLHSSHPAAEQPSQGINHADNDNDAAPTVILGAAPLDQQSPLPSNALVAYSSDEDDWHNAVDATESMPWLYIHWQS